MSAFDEAELARLQEIAALNLGDEVKDPAIQLLVDRAADELDLPLAAISIVLDSAQYFIASHGLDGWIAVSHGTVGEWAFCRNAVESREPFVVEDAGDHPIVRDNPLVELDGIRSYLGVPLITTQEQPIGTLCVLGTETRKFSPDDLRTLSTLADQVMAELETRRQESH